MSSNNLKREVLRCFKSLHLARKLVFNGDEYALTEGRKKINEEFRKYKDIKDTETIQQLICDSKAAEVELRTCIIQAKEISPGVYQAKITSDTLKLDNVPFKCDAEEEDNSVVLDKTNKKCS